MPTRLQSRAAACLAATLVAAAFPGRAPAQEWTDDQLVAAAQGFQSDALTARLQQVGKLLAARDQAFSAIVARIHGDHREYLLKIDRLLAELVDERWQTRESAERTLIEIGGGALGLIQQHREKYEVLEQSIRCARILDALAAKGTEQEEREMRLLRGLVATALYLDPDPRLQRALRSAAGHNDASVVDGAIRALGRLGGEDDATAVRQMIEWRGGLYRSAALAALGRMPNAQALAICRELLTGGTLNRTEQFAILRGLRGRADADPLVRDLTSHPDAVLAAAARITLPRSDVRTKARFTLPDRSQLDASFGGMIGSAVVAVGGFEGVPIAELSIGDCDVVEFPERPAGPVQGARVFLNQGSLVIGELVAIDATTVSVRSPLFGPLQLPRRDVQGIAVDPEIDRMVGASAEHDRVRLRSNEFIDGSVVSVRDGMATVALHGGEERRIELAKITGILLTRPRAIEPDTTIYTRTDLATGERLIGFVGDSNGERLVVSVPLLGAAVIPLQQVTRMELGVGGGAMWGFTLIADYSDNKIVEVDDQGRVTFSLDEVLGAWDAECLDNGNLLITEFSVSRVQEIDRKRQVVWVFEDLKNPYDADRLPNGNTLIADTFGSRVIEVDKAGQIVWSFAKDIRPFDCDRLANGNTLIADVLKDRVLEVSAAGEVVWEVKNLPNVHDADRLPNGNTLITLRNKGVVIEVDRDGKTVWELTGLSSPSDADRLPNGHTLVAENSRAREFDRRGNEVWKKDMTWAVEVNRY